MEGVGDDSGGSTFLETILGIPGVDGHKSAHFGVNGMGNTSIKGYVWFLHALGVEEESHICGLSLYSWGWEASVGGTDLSDNANYYFADFESD